MSDWKTAAELRKAAHDWRASYADQVICLHLAAVEEERERDVETVPDAVHEGGWQWRPTSPSTAFAPPLGTIRACDACGALVAGGPTRCIHCVRGVEDEREDKDAPVERDLRAMTALSDVLLDEEREIRSALNAGPEESTVGAAKRVVQERDSLVGKWKEVDDLTRSRDDWKARHDQVFAEADVKIDELRRAVKNADAFAHAMAAKAGAAERLAADALRIGLEECERLRAESGDRLLKWSQCALERDDARVDNAHLRAELHGEVRKLMEAREEARALRAELAALKGERERVGEWWEVRTGWDSVFVPKRWRTRELARQACVEGCKVVHVTRWRKKR